MAGPAPAIHVLKRGKTWMPRHKAGHDEVSRRSTWMSTDKMLSRKEGKVGYLTVNNPERHNAVSLEMWEAAEGCLEEFKNDKNIRVVVVTGAGGKAFISGADISKFEKERTGEEAVARYNAIVEQSYAKSHEFPK